MFDEQGWWRFCACLELSKNIIVKLASKHTNKCDLAASVSYCLIISREQKLHAVEVAMQNVFF